MIYDLSCRYDPRASFYGKAQVEQDEKEVRLYSYGTLVATIEKLEDCFRFHYLGKYSQTTTRHQKEFFRQARLSEEQIKELFKYGNLQIPFSNISSIF